MLANLIIETIFGALAGYATNDVAIKTLFKPGGIIEKNREHFTRQISALLEKEVLTAEDLEQIISDGEVIDAISAALECLMNEIPLSLQNVSLNQLDNGYLPDLLCRYAAKVQNNGELKQLIITAIAQSLPQETADALTQTLDSALKNSFTTHAPLNAFRLSSSPLLDAKSALVLEEYFAGQAEQLALQIYADKELKEALSEILLSSLPAFMEKSVTHLLNCPIKDFLVSENISTEDKIAAYLHSQQGEELLYFYSETIYNAFVCSPLTIGQLLTQPPVESIILPLIAKQWPLICSIFLQWLSDNKPYLTTMIDQAIQEALNEQEGISALISKILHDFLGDGERFSAEFLQKAQEFLLENLEAEQILAIIQQGDISFLQTPLSQLAPKFSPRQIQSILTALILQFKKTPTGQKLLSSPLKELIGRLQLDYELLSKELLDYFWQPQLLRKGLNFLLYTLISYLTTRTPAEILKDWDLSAAEIDKLLEAKLGQSVTSLSAQELIGALINLLLQNHSALAAKISAMPLNHFCQALLTDHIRQMLLPALTSLVQKLLITHLPGKLSPLAYESLNTLSNEEMLALVREFMGKELKPLNYLGAGMGGIVGLATGSLLSLLPAETFQGLYLGGKLAVFGAVGYTTNCAAVKGLFWPYKPLGGIRTLQGVIPKRQASFAQSLAQLFDSYVLNPVRLAEILEQKKDELSQILCRRLAPSQEQCLNSLNKIPALFINHCPQASERSFQDLLKLGSFNFSPNTADDTLLRQFMGYLDKENIFNEHNVQLIIQKLTPSLSAKSAQWLAAKTAQELLSPKLRDKCTSYLLSQAEQRLTPQLAEKAASQLNDSLSLVTPSLFCPKPLHLPDKLIITLLDFLCNYLKEHQDKLTLFAQNLIKSRLNMLQTFGYLAMNGDLLLANILSRFIQIKFPLFCGLKSAQLKDRAEEYFQSLLSTSLAHSGLMLSGDFCYWLLSTQASREMLQHSVKNLWHGALNIPLAHISQNTAFKAIMPFWQQSLAELLPKLDNLAIPLARYSQELNLSLFLSSLSLPTQEALAQDIRQFCQDFCTDISLRSPAALLGGLDLRTMNERFFSFWHSDEMARAYSAEINKHLSQDFALYLSHIAEPLSQLALSIFLGQTNSYANILEKMHLSEHIAAKTAQIDPHYLEKMIRSFAQEYFNHIQNMGWWGSVFALGGVLFNLFI